MGCFDAMFIALVFWTIHASSLDIQIPTTTWTTLLDEPGTSEKGDFTYLNSLPIGNGETTALVSVDHEVDVGETAFLQLLIESQTAWDEGCEPYKSTLVKITPAEEYTQLTLKSFTSMTLNMSTGTVNVKFGEDFSFDIFVDATTNLIVVNSTVGLSYSTRKLREEPYTKVPYGSCDNATVSRDHYSDDGSFFAHRNEEDGFFTKTLERLNVNDRDGTILNPLLNRTTGGQVFDLSGTGDMTLVGIAMLTDAFSPSIDDFTKKLSTIVDNFKNEPYDKSDHDNSWAEFNSRSYLLVTSSSDSDNANTVTRQYQINRYLQRLQSSTPNPIKFNGMSFTATRVPNEEKRDWGGSNWWQNVRHQYYSMLSAGDFDGLRISLFETYLSYIPYMRTKTKQYFPEMENAIFFDEYQSVIGNTHAQNYGCTRNNSAYPISYSQDVWNGYNWQGALDLSKMMLDYFSHTGDEDFLGICMELIVGNLNFYRQRWTRRTVEGKIIMFPTQSIETYQCKEYFSQHDDIDDGNNCPTNDTPTVSGLRSVLETIFNVPTETLARVGIDAEKLDDFKKFYDEIPIVPLETIIDDATNETLWTIRPCETCSMDASNVENPELYAVHPYFLYTAGELNNAEHPLTRENLQIAVNAFNNVKNPGDTGWNQMAMDAALLGLGLKAQELVTARAASDPAPGYRFEGFMPHEFDYDPSSDHMGVFSAALQYMLVQTANDVHNTITLLPSWPCSWDVDFRIFTKKETVIEGSIKNGTLIGDLVVTPEERRENIVFGQCQLQA